jgi:hypothetical protein
MFDDAATISIAAVCTVGAVALSMYQVRRSSLVLANSKLGPLLK